MKQDSYVNKMAQFGKNNVLNTDINQDIIPNVVDLKKILRKQAGDEVSSSEEKQSPLNKHLIFIEPQKCISMSVIIDDFTEDF